MLINTLCCSFEVYLNSKLDLSYSLFSSSTKHLMMSTYDCHRNCAEHFISHVNSLNSSINQLPTCYKLVNCTSSYSGMDAFDEYLMISGIVSYAKEYTFSPRQFSHMLGNQIFLQGLKFTYRMISSSGYFSFITKLIEARKLHGHELYRFIAHISTAIIISPYIYRLVEVRPSSLKHEHEDAWSVLDSVNKSSSSGGIWENLLYSCSRFIPILVIVPTKTTQLCLYLGTDTPSVCGAAFSVCAVFTAYDNAQKHNSVIHSWISKIHEYHCVGECSSPSLFPLRNVELAYARAPKFNVDLYSARVLPAPSSFAEYFDIQSTKPTMNAIGNSSPS